MRNKTHSLLNPERVGLPDTIYKVGPKHPENLFEQGRALLRYFLDKLRSQFTDEEKERVN